MFFRYGKWVGSPGADIWMDSLSVIFLSLIPLGLFTLHPQDLFLLFKSPSSSVGWLLLLKILAKSSSWILRFGCWYAAIIRMCPCFCRTISTATASRIASWGSGYSFCLILFLIIIAVPPETHIESLSFWYMLYCGILNFHQV